MVEERKCFTSVGQRKHSGAEGLVLSGGLTFFPLLLWRLS